MNIGQIVSCLHSPVCEIFPHSLMLVAAMFIRPVTVRAITNLFQEFTATKHSEFDLTAVSQLMNKGI